MAAPAGGAGATAPPGGAAAPPAAAAVCSPAYDRRWRAFGLYGSRRRLEMLAERHAEEPLPEEERRRKSALAKREETALLAVRREIADIPKNTSSRLSDAGGGLVHYWIFSSYFNAKMRGSRRTAKSDRSKPALPGGFVDLGFRTSRGRVRMAGPASSCCCRGAVFSRGVACCGRVALWVPAACGCCTLRCDMGGGVVWAVRCFLLANAPTSPAVLTRWAAPSISSI